ncbi:PhzF family phenazine biosynthesis protein [Embleya sp. AB8]|uniref:PhzF family phenazine biosynthesis protein n=1 Tax=Embleya sp. AB8 TaxID=3156304 RepID=UPI003C743688
MSGRLGLSVAVVRACLRDGGGGSPTAVMYDAALSDDERCRVPVVAGTSHAVFVSVYGGSVDPPSVGLRFFTAEGELPACGHGTVAALAFLAGRAERAERAEGAEYRVVLRAGGRDFVGWGVREGAYVRAGFDAGPVELREPTVVECDPVLSALGIGIGIGSSVADGIRVASVGRARLLVPVATRSVLAALDPDFERLRAACDRVGFLGCYVYSVPTSTGRVAARMFAPSIGVAEDIANANSTACLAAHLATGRGRVDLAVDMGDSLGSPATITATTRPGPSGPLIQLGGTAEIAGNIRLL